MHTAPRPALPPLVPRGSTLVGHTHTHTHTVNHRRFGQGQRAPASPASSWGINTPSSPRPQLAGALTVVCGQGGRGSAWHSVVSWLREYLAAPQPLPARPAAAPRRPKINTQTLLPLPARRRRPLGSCTTSALSFQCSPVRLALDGFCVALLYELVEIYVFKKHLTKEKQNHSSLFISPSTYMN